MLGAVAAGVLTCIVGTVIFRDATAGSRARFLDLLPAWRFPLLAQTIMNPPSAESVTRILPAHAAPDGRTVYLLRYPDRGFTRWCSPAATEPTRFTWAHWDAGDAWCTPSSYPMGGIRPPSSPAYAKPFSPAQLPEPRASRPLS